ncbi:MAG: hypothetical protein AAGG44_16725 [Planctomycetota bacterium]
MHEIRLREPWKQVVCTTDDLPSGGSTAANDGSLFQRNFNCPTGISSQQQLVIEIRLTVADARVQSNLNDFISVELNGEILESEERLPARSDENADPISASQPTVSEGCKYPLQADLRPFNELRIRLHAFMLGLQPGPETKLTDLLSVSLLIFD